MENKQYSQQLSADKNGKQPHSLYMAYSAQVEEGDEGGLELGELLAAMRRRILISYRSNCCSRFCRQGSGTD